MASRAAKQAEKEFVEGLAKFSRAQLSREVIGPEQTQLLRQLFGSRLEGRGAEQATRALDALKGGQAQVPEGITRQTLLAYREVAQRAIDQGIAKGAQQVRLKIINEALKRVKQ